MTHPSPTNTALAEELLPNTGCNCNQGRLERLGYHDQWCTLYYRPAVVLALQAKDDAHGVEIEGLKAEIGRLREALEPFEWAEKRHPSMRDFIEGIRISHAKIKARAALQGEGGKQP